MVIPSRGLQPSVIQLHEPVPGYVIEGVSVEFPYRPYFPQIGVIRIVLRTLCRTEAASSLHSLIEVPAGIGKSLALLCAALSWQQRLKDNSHSQAPASAPPAANNANKIPAIYYASRTHAQLSQVVGEYQKTGLIMAVLDLRKHCCTNENLQGHADIDMECKGLLKNWEAGCPEFKNIQKVKDDSTLKKGRCYEVHAIEDLVQVGKHVKACSMANDAELVFCPYSYIINPVIRRALDVNIEGSILIIDESHNIEDICHDVGSVDVGMKCLNEHKVLDASSRSFFAHAKLHMLGLMEALNQLSKASVTKESFSNLQECASKISEGIDFSYEKARAVIFIGIPYPDKDDLRFKLKMMFNNAYASYSAKLLRLNVDLVKGEDWYNIQAFKPLNQAAGRCIRPRHDYGAFIFIDERFSEKSQRDHLSDWFKETVINYSRFEDAIEKVSQFFNAQNG